MKKCVISAIILILTLGILSGNTIAASASISSSSRELKVGDKITVTVNFGQKVSAAQFTLNFDSNKLEYGSCYCSGDGISEFKPTTKRFGYIGTKSDTSSVSFNFTARSTGSINISVSRLEIANDMRNSNSRFCRK